MKKKVLKLLSLSLATVLLVSDIGVNSVYAAQDEIIVDETEFSVTEEEIIEEDDFITETDEISETIEEELSEDIIEEDIEIVDDDDSLVTDYITEEVTDDYAIVTPTGGLMEMEFVECNDISSDEIVYDVNELYDEYLELQLTDETATVDDLFAEDGESIYAVNWDKYSSYYVYNKLPAKKQIAWKAYYKICKEVLTGNKSYSSPAFGYVRSDGVFSDLSDFMDFSLMFKYSNPQFYFISNTVSGGSDYYSFYMYDNFKSSSKRATATDKYISGINAFKNKIKASTNEGATFQSIHDAICALVTYNHDSVRTGHQYEQSEYTQSSYSTFVLKTTVCAGYAMALSVLCNEYGIGAQALTAPGHAYNRVRINHIWYNVDSTWADQDWGVYYGYYLKSTKTYSDAGYSSHIPDTFFNKYLPPCSKDAPATSNYVPGVPTKPTSTVATPVVKISSGKVTITCSTSGAKIYYTTDGKTPSSYKNISSVYSKEFTYSSGSTIKAIAVKDGKLDSKVATKAPTYKITYELNGGKNNSGNPSSYTKANATITLLKPTKKGYSFKGWYKESSFKNKVTTIDRSKAVNVKVYAKWSPIKYTVKFNANGGSGTVSSQTMTYNKSTVLNKNNFTKKGYTFKGWATSKTDAKNGKVKYANKAKVKNLSSKSGAIVTLYAVWKKK